MKQSVTEAPRKAPLSQTEFRAARECDARSIVACYESVFGVRGVRAPGHEPYPAPEVFSEDGVKQILADPKRQFMVVECDGEVVAGMIISHNSRVHREFGCVCVSKQFQGQSISSFMLKAAKDLEREQALSINVTEIVTHSMLSQSAHRKAGYAQITGFGFCQYPNVFFLNHPESCLWITSFEGSVIDLLRRSRPVGFAGDSSNPFREASLDESGWRLFSALKSPRSIFVPECYYLIVAKIASQFDDTFSYRIHSSTNGVDSKPQLDWVSDDWQIDECGEYPYAILNLPARPVGSSELAEQMRAVSTAKKRYLQARISTGDPSAIRNIEILRAAGFAFLGWIPLFRCTSDDVPQFDDVLIMQWLRDDVQESNSLPGETDAVAKLHGYPLNLTGDLISTIRSDFKNSRGRGE